MLFYNLIKKMGKRKGEDYPLLSKKIEEKQSSATIMISVDGKGTFL